MAVNSTQVNVFSYSGTNVTTGAYVELVASLPTACGKIQIVDNSTKILKIAKGLAGSEVDLFCVSGNQTVSLYLEAGTRLSIKAIDASATTGYNVLSFLS